MSYNGSNAVDFSSDFRRSAKRSSRVCIYIPVGQEHILDVRGRLHAIFQIQHSLSTFLYTILSRVVIVVRFD